MDIRDLVGCKYKAHGRIPEEGLDCYGLAIHAVKILKGVDLPDFVYAENEERGRLKGDMVTSIPNKKLDGPEKGAIAEIDVMGQPSHVGVCLGDGTFIHATKRLGVVIERLARYRNKTKGYYRVGN